MAIQLGRADLRLLRRIFWSGNSIVKSCTVHIEIILENCTATSEECLGSKDTSGEWIVLKGTLEWISSVHEHVGKWSSIGKMFVINFSVAFHSRRMLTLFEATSIRTLTLNNPLTTFIINFFFIYSFRCTLELYLSRTKYRYRKLSLLKKYANTYSTSDLLPIVFVIKLSITRWILLFQKRHLNIVETDTDYFDFRLASDH